MSFLTTPEVNEDLVDFCFVLEQETLFQYNLHTT